MLGPVIEYYSSFYIINHNSQVLSNFIIYYNSSVMLYNNHIHYYKSENSLYCNKINSSYAVHMLMSVYVVSKTCTYIIIKPVCIATYSVSKWFFLIAANTRDFVLVLFFFFFVVCVFI